MACPGYPQAPERAYARVELHLDPQWDDAGGAACAALMIQPDGTVNIIGIRSDVGVNAETTYCEIIAGELGMRS